MPYVPPHLRGGIRRAPTTFTSYEIDEKLHLVPTNTLRVTETGELGAIVVFAGQHPLFNELPHPKLFCHTHIEALPAALEAGAEIPVFVPADFGGSNRQRSDYEFGGWHKIIGVEYAEPRSEQLKELLTIKWSRGGERTEQAWSDSLGQRWATVSLQKIQERKDNPMHS